MLTPRVSIGSCLCLIGLIAADLAVLRGWVLAAGGGGATSADLLGLSVLPMFNVLMIAGAARRRDRPRRRAFARGFLLCGMAAMLAHAALDLFWSQALVPLYSAPFLPFMEFCQAHLPNSFAPLPGGRSYFRYYPALGIVYSAPQFLIAFLGGVVSALVARAARPPGMPPNLALQRTRPPRAVSGIINVTGRRPVR